MLPPAKVSGTLLNHAILAEGCILKAKEINNSVIGIRSRIGEGSTIESCYIMGNDYYETLEEIQYNYSKGVPPIGIGDNCHLKNVIVDKDVRIGNNVSISGSTEYPDADHSLLSIKDGIVVIKKGAVLPDGFSLNAP